MERFFDFLRGTLIPQVKAFDGFSSHSVIVLDNASVHHVHDVTDILANAGVIALFLPPYSPDLNPIEEAFSFVKQYLRRHDELLQALPDPTLVLQAAFAAITPDHCKAWIEHSGYSE